MSKAWLWLYFSPMFLCYLGLWAEIKFNNGPIYDRIPRWGAIGWFILGLVPALNFVLGVVSFFSVFRHKPVADWLSAPVKDD